MACEFRTQKEVINKVIEKGFSDEKMEITHEITCGCGETFLMDTYLVKCEKCSKTYAVTPCSAHDKENIVVD